MQSAEKPLRFELLDAMRGVAAIAVLVYHYTQHSIHWMPGAWISVDLFFVLSGFVLMHSYGPRISSTMTFREFAKARIVRLAPLYIVGLGVGLFAMGISMQTPAGANLTVFDIAASAAPNLVALPSFNHVIWPYGDHKITGVLYPFDLAAWSLFFELLVNIVFYFWLKHYRRSPGPVAVALMLLVFVGCSFGLGMANPGWGAPNLIFGVPRVCAEFFLGTFIYESGIWRRLRYPWLAGAVCLIGLATFMAHSATVAILSSVTVLPLSIVLVSGLKAPLWSNKLCAFLGDLSYPLYVLHYPIYRLSFELFHMDRFSRVDQTIGMAAAAVVFSFLLVPVDAKLRRRIFRQRLANATI